MAIDEDFIEKVKLLLKERENFQKTIANLVVEKQQALDENVTLNSKVTEMLGEAVKHGKEVDAALFAEMDVLKDKERVRSQIIDAKVAEVAQLAKRNEKLEKKLARLAYELENFLEDILPAEEEPEKQRIEDAKPDFAEVAEKNGEVESEWHESDEHERSPAGYDGEDYAGMSAWQKLRLDLFKGIRRPLSKRTLKLSAKVTTLVEIAASVPFMLMAVLFAFAYSGIIVQPFYDLMAGWWQPWMGSTWVQGIVFAEPVVVACHFLLVERPRRQKSYVQKPVDEAVVDESGMTKAEEEARVSKMLDEAFGDEDST